jgi:hypothetical protein
MTPAELLPLYLPDPVRAPFCLEGVTHRFAKVARLEAGHRVLDLGAGPLGLGGLLLAREYGCSVVVGAAGEPAQLSALHGQVKALGLEGRVELRPLDPASPALPLGELRAILLQGRMLYPLSELLTRLRPLLSMDGRVGVTYPVRVGRHVPEAVLERWQQRLGEPLRMPRELLGELEHAGFEPEMVESLEPQELESFYQGLEPYLDEIPAEHAQVLREEIALFREQRPRSGASYAFLVGRRKQPGERPFSTHDQG